MFLYPSKLKGSLHYIKYLMREFKLDKYIDKITQKVDIGLKSNLSSGEKQKIMIISAILKQPKILIMDEPFSNLDKSAIKTACSLIKRELYETTVIFTSHIIPPKDFVDYLINIDSYQNDLVIEEYKHMELLGQEGDEASLEL